MKTINKLIFGGFLVVSATIILSISIKNNTLESFRSSAKIIGNCKCVPCASCDCMDAGSGNIYAGYKSVCN